MMKINQSCNIYFFDFFGTIMNRTCSADDVKRLWSNRMAKRLGMCVPSSVLYKIRRGAEAEICKKERDFEFTYNELTDAIYKRLLAVTDKITFSMETFYAMALEVETGVETDVQVVNQPVVDMIMKLKGMNKRLFVLSDFYLPKFCFTDFLEMKGLSGIFEDIFVSCHFDTNKASGRLYPLVLEKLGVSASECFMTGDNHTSDYLNAKANGLGAYNVKENKKFNQKIDNRKELYDILTFEKKDGLSYSNYAFVLYLFTQRLYKELIDKSYKKAFFLSREGEFLKKLFDEYSLYMHNTYGLPRVESKYLYVSRQSTFPASLRPLEEEDFTTLFSSYPTMSIRVFLEHIGIRESDAEEIMQSLEGNTTEDIKNLWESKVFADLLANEKFRQVYADVYLANKMTFLNYLRNQGFFDDKQVALVDVGWRGSMQDYIYRSIEGGASLTGYYVGLGNNADISEDNKKYGLVFSEYPYKSDHHRIWSFDSNFMERLLSASHPSTRTYVIENDKINPVFNEFGKEEDNYRLIKPVQEYIMEKFRRILEAESNLPVLDDEFYRLCMEAHIEACTKVTGDNMRLQQKLLKGQNENFGYLVSSGDRLKKVFSVKNILRKLFSDAGLLKNSQLIARVLMTKGFYGISAAIYRSNKRRLRKEIK